MTGAALNPYRGDVGELKEVYAQYPSGIAALGASIDGRDVLMIASSFTVGVSYEPPMCSVAIQRVSQTWPVLRRAARIGVSGLGAEHVGSVWQLASRQRDNRLDEVAATRTTSGALLLDGATAWMECVPVAEHDAGDHVIVVLQVVATRIEPARDPLILHRGRVFAPVAEPLAS